MIGKRKNIVWLLSLGLVILGFNGYGQQQTFTQYYLNLPSVNPGFTGMEPYLDVKSAFRQRWNGFEDKNNSIYLSGYASLGRTSPTVFKNNSLRISSPEAYDKVANSGSLKRMHGIGGMVTSQTVGPFKSMSANVNYAYHLPLSRSLSLSMGTGVRYINYDVNLDGYTFREESDPFIDRLKGSNGGRLQQFVGDFGIALYSDKFYMGFSSANLVSENMSGGELLQLDRDVSYHALVGIQIDLGPIINFYPGGRLSYSDLHGVTWEANARIRYSKMIYLGLAYENDVKASLLFGLTFENRYSINYSYDYYFNELKEFTTGNHEFTLGIAIFNKYSTPARLW
ncbi:PorP/SprF family type IX secretion system membrane protein [Fulvivirga sp. 29W222]|uniref:PorP/SprF family type IX secretion system membrane protein n=1 Tax=Fulvivirga marina TaxID=2494733 RepID=A0A937G5Q6_9BACT|nr:PorP/SprF family type IX secretion system membrane protein [Fulvivirga marina]MBL6448916.1 PorP/SprF family type IX secretion system membrane protein [Fulvivirga marina]